MRVSPENLQTIEIEPQAPAVYSVIWLHGLGADGNDFVPFVDALQLPQHLPARFIFPHAPIMPITINGGYAMRAWYDIYSIDINARVDEINIASSIGAVQDLISRELERGVAANHIILGGFSQGSVIAVLAGLSSAVPLCGIVALSGYLPRAALKPNPANLQTPIFMAHGTEDPVVAYSLGKAAYMFLKEKNYNVTWKSYAMGHTASPEEVSDIRSWLLKIWG